MKAVVSIMELVALEDITVVVVAMVVRGEVVTMLTVNSGLIAVIIVVAMDSIMVVLKTTK